MAQGSKLKGHEVSLKYEPQFRGYILTLEALTCMNSWWYVPVLAPLICSQFFKDVIHIGKNVVGIDQLVGRDSILELILDESADTLAFVGACHAISGFALTGWPKVFWKTIAGLIHVLSDRWYDLAFYPGEFRDILIYTGTYAAQYTGQQILGDVLESSYGHMPSKMVSRASSTAMGSLVRDVYSHGEVNLAHSLEGLIKGLLYGSKISYQLFEPYITEQVVLHYLEPLVIENIGVMLENGLFNHFDA